MPTQSLVEVADRKSRLRAILFAFATLVFLLVQLVTHPAFNNEPYSHGWRMYAWAFNAGLLLLCLGGGGGFMNSAALRALIQDEVARAHNRAACTAGFWVAVVSALVLYSVPAFQSFTGRQVSYVVVTLSAATALLVFSWLEFRAHADA
jgi:hypothetical protein